MNSVDRNNWPVLDETGKDGDGNRWITALVDTDRRVLAGRDHLGNFRQYAGAEEVYDKAIETLHHVTQQGG